MSINFPGRTWLSPPRVRRVGKDQIGIAVGAIGILLAIDHVQIAGARRFDTEPDSLAHLQRRVGFNALRSPLGWPCVLPLPKLARRRRFLLPAAVARW